MLKVPMPNPAFLILVVIAVAFRFAAAIALGDYEPPKDPASYVALAEGVMAGEGLTLDHPRYGDNVRALYPPLYPIILAAVGWLIGISSLSITLLNTAIDIAAGLTIVRLGRQLGQAGGVSAAAAYLLWPAFILSAPVAQKEGLAILLVLLIIAALDRLSEQPAGGWRDPIIVGTCTGLLALTQPGLVPLALCVGLVLLPKAGFIRLAAAAMRAVPFAIIVMLPWWVRNWFVFHQFVPLTTSGGHVLMANVNGFHVAPPTDVQLLPEPERSSAMTARALDRIAADPLSFVGTTIREGIAVGLRESFAVDRFFGRDSVLVRLIGQAAYLIALVLAGLAAWRMPNPRLNRLFLGCLLALLIVGVWFSFQERHRYFLMPLILLLGAPLLGPLFVAGPRFLWSAKRVP